LPKTVKVHEDTHRALKQLKLNRRNASLDEVIREMIRSTTGLPVEKIYNEPSAARLTSYIVE
jgi:predicted CopG family antitoxin